MRYTCDITVVKQLFLYAIGIWFILVIVAILNGAFREGFIRPGLGEYPGHILSTIILVVIIWIATYLFIRAVDRRASNTDFLLIGVLWLVLTVIFEFLFRSLRRRPVVGYVACQL